MKKAIITIAGSPGSGKSSTAKAVATALRYQHFSSGDLFRTIAQERGVSVEEVNLQNDVDALVDAKLREIYEKDQNIVIDSRLGWHWMPGSFKVFLALDLETASERIFANIKREGRVSEAASNVAELRASIERRFAKEQEKYHDMYGIDPTDRVHYDLVIDTKVNTLEAVIKQVLDGYAAWRNT